MIKKIILVSFMTSVLFAADSNEFESKLFDLNKVKSGEMREFLVALECLTPSLTEVIKDYYEAKTCNLDFYNEISIEDIKGFAEKSPVFSTLVAISTLNSGKKDINENQYLQVINDYKFINCGKGKIYNPEKYGFKRVEN